MANIRKTIRSLGLVFFLLVLWQFLSGSKVIPSFMLPSPWEVLRAFLNDFPLLMSHLGVTLVEALVGLFTGVLLGFVFALSMDRNKLVYDSLYPILVISQTIPTVAIAPLLVLWLGYGILPKVVLIVLVTFFPMAVNLFEGFSSADKDEIRLLKAMGAKEWQIFTYVKWPSTLENFFSALKISSSYAVIGAVIAEWLGGFKGLGVYMTRVKSAYAFDRMFAVIFLISILSLVLLFFVDQWQKFSMPWVYKKSLFRKEK